MFDALSTARDAQPGPFPGGTTSTTAPPGRPSWSGLLQFSLVGIPLKAYPAVRSRDVPTCHQLHAGCGQRLRYAKHCPAHGRVDAAAIVRGYEYGPGQHVVVEPEELDRLRPAKDHALRLERFLAPAQLDPLLFAGRSLYLLPDGPAAEPGYQVLQTAMAQRGCWALGRMVLGGHRQVVLVRAAAAVLVLQVLHYPEHLKAYPRAAGPQTGEPGVSEELRLAGVLIEATSGEVDWGAYRDTTAQELRALVEAKLQGHKAQEGGPTRALLPLLEALQQSVAAAQTQGETAGRGKQRVGRRRSGRTA
jgi:DNA end-binding protein Ku